ncbi:Imidazoleglycerol-phosphate dehydratase [uncultured delta proteobacterium]|uniref:Imidazoleglycerol-phosphate dehydratase n=1 Tax=uncultured delta proteobacterium TaxID=34034 RepID=A0A212J833_9DELT|nr:Imidazoleglycerol-phosphate dehydratase [uncultured delta proteobacterium]
MTSRQTTLRRTSSETDISLSLSLDGKKEISVKTGYGFADHMITLLAFWAGFDLTLECKGDLDVDAHHTVEDAALCLGQALLEALGDRKGIARVGTAKVPMDESLADVAIDLSGRPFLVFRGEELLPEIIAGEERALWHEFFKSFASGARMNLHISFLYGSNGHHLLESACKGLGLALRSAVSLSGTSILSTKGRLD